MKEFKVDAKDKKLGRLASHVAFLLRGKGDVHYLPHDTNLTRVVVTNVDGISITPKKLKEKIYNRYSGYPGGRYESTAATVLAKKDMQELLRRAVNGMLPPNRLKKHMLKNLIMYKGDAK